MSVRVGARVAPSSGVRKLRRPVSSLWTPADLSSVLWWLDASQITGLADGADVATWEDAIGSIDAVQTTEASRPTYETGVINGKPVVRFGATDSMVTNAALDMSASDEMTVWAVVAAPSGTDSVIAEMSANFNLQTDSWLLFRKSTNVVSFGTRGAGSSSADSVQTVTTTPRIIVGTADRALATDECTMRIDGDAFVDRLSNTNNTGNLGNRLVYLGARNQSSLYLAGDIAEIGVCSTALGSTDTAALEGYLAAKYGYEMVMVFDGDSMTSGSTLTTPGTESYPSQVKALLATQPLTYNFGVGSQTLVSMASDAATQVDPIRSSAFVANVCVVWGGANDIAGDASAATVLTRIEDYCTARQTAGWTVLVCTLNPMASLSGAKETVRQDVNTGLRNTWATFADAIVDIAADPLLDDFTDGTYYNVDQVHMTAAGYAVVAGLVDAELVSLGFA